MVLEFLPRPVAEFKGNFLKSAKCNGTKNIAIFAIQIAPISSLRPFWSHPKNFGPRPFSTVILKRSNQRSSLIFGVDTSFLDFTFIWGRVSGRANWKYFIIEKLTKKVIFICGMSLILTVVAKLISQMMIVKFCVKMYQISRTRNFISICCPEDHPREGF